MYRRDTVSTFLTIAGSDNMGGAGIQADIKTASAFGVYASSVVTAITAQTKKDVAAIFHTPLDLLALQIDTIFESFQPDAVKIGMIPSPEAVNVIADRLKRYGAKNIVVDPVIVSLEGETLKGRNKEIFDETKDKLFPISTLVTPNFDEALAITGLERLESAKDFGKILYEKSGAPAVLLKGGDSKSDYCTDILFDDEETRMFRQSKISTDKTHGTGSVLSSAIACGLAKGFILSKAVRMAKDYVSFAIQKGVDMKLDYGNGPLYIFNR